MLRNTSPAMTMLLPYLVLLYFVKAQVIDTNSTVYTLGPVEKAENNVTFAFDPARNNATESPEESSSLVLTKAVFSQQTKCTSPMVYDAQRNLCVKASRFAFAGDGNPIWRRKRR